MKFKWIKDIDDKFAAIGFIKVYESNLCVCYVRKMKTFGYVQSLDLYHKRIGEHSINSFQKGVNSEGFNNSVGLTIYEAKLCLKKMKQKGWR